MLDVNDYDMTLGMDFFSKCWATIDGKAETVGFKPPGEEIFTLFGDRRSNHRIFISAMQARKWLADDVLAIWPVYLTRLRRGKMNSEMYQR